MTFGKCLAFSLWLRVAIFLKRWVKLFSPEYTITQLYMDVIRYMYLTWYASYSNADLISHGLKIEMNYQWFIVFCFVLFCSFGFFVCFVFIQNFIIVHSNSSRKVKGVPKHGKLPVLGCYLIRSKPFLTEGTWQVMQLVDVRTKQTPRRHFNKVSFLANASMGIQANFCQTLWL